MTPNQRCNIWDGKGETYEVRVITLAVWTHGMKAACKGLDIKDIEKVVRRELRVPRDMSTDDLYQHLRNSLDDVNEQLEQLENA